MHDVNNLHESLKGTLLDAVWRQWAALDSPAEERRPARAIVDPEALVLVSLQLIEEERRLWDLLAWWGRAAPRLLSVQRVKNLAGRFGEASGGRLAQFAHLAFEEGGDARWKSLDRSVPDFQARSSKVDAPSPVLRHRSTLMLLLRRGIGVGIKPDLLAVLIGSEGPPRDVRFLSRATAYSNRAVRRAAEEMAEARLIRVAQESPVGYTADGKSWLAVLQLDPPPPGWLAWHELFPLCQRLLEIMARLQGDGSRYTASSKLRDLVEDYGETLRRTGLELPDPTRRRGEEYLEPFLAFVPKLGAWIRDSV